MSIDGKPTPYADQFIGFQSLLDRVGPAYHEMKQAIQYRDEGMEIDLEPYRENYRMSLVKTLSEYNRLLTKIQLDEIQKNSEKKSIDQLVKEYSDSLSSNYEQTKVIECLQIKDIRAAERNAKPKSELALKAEQRPADFEQLDAEAQWMIDKELGILDWDGS